MNAFGRPRHVNGRLALLRRVAAASCDSVFEMHILFETIFFLITRLLTS